MAPGQILPRSGIAMRFPIRESQFVQFRKELQRRSWVERAMDRFQHLILFGESQPSNGTVRGVDRPDGRDFFMVGYGSEPDEDLKALLVCH